MPFKNMVCVTATLGRRVQSAVGGAISIVMLLSGMAEQVQAAPITWIGGNVDWDATNANWTPADEPDADDEAIFNTPNTVNLAIASQTIQALTMSGGIDLNLNGNDLTVDGLVQLTDSSTTLIVGGATSLLTADSMTMGSGGVVRLTGGTITIIEETGSGILTVTSSGTLTGHGTINLNDSVAAGTVLLSLNGGALTATSNTSGDLFGSVAATLTINVADADARIDLDQTPAIVSIGRNDTLQINGLSHQATDPFSGTLNLGEGATFNSDSAWQTDFGTINVNTGGIIAGSVGTAATIAGAAVSFNGGSINLNAVDTLRLSAPFTSTAGTIANAGHIIFNAATTIGAGTDFQMTGNSAALTVEATTAVNIDDPDFNPNGGSTATNVITINSGGVLDIDWGAGAGEVFSNVLNFAGGELDVTTASNTWTINGDVNVALALTSSQINGEQVTFTNVTVDVAAGAFLDVNAPSVWSNNGSIVTGLDGRVDLDGSTVTFNNAGTFTGLGILNVGGNATVSTATTFNMPNGTVHLDGNDAAVNSWLFNANLTVNAGTMGAFGDAAADTLTFNPFFSLTVNLTAAGAEWTIGPQGVVTISAAGGMLAGGGIHGSDVNVAGTVNISGNSTWTARVDLTGTVNVAAAGSWSVRGGTLTNLNRIEGGTITGAGGLRSLTDSGLAGFGTINTDITFLNNTVLFADDGILNINAPILDVGTIGTADVDGILNVTTAWNTNVAGQVILKGGELRGATITNDNSGAPIGGIRGHGLLSARVINNRILYAEGGTLIIQTAANDNDWDGAAGTGQLDAILGNLEIRDNATPPFTGTVIANQDHEVFVNGFELEFEPAASLILGSGTFRSTVSTDFGGTLSVAAPVGGPSMLRISGLQWVFENGSSTSLTGNLHLDNTSTVIQVGADFTGGGALVNLPSRRLVLLDGVVSTDFNVLVINQGLFNLGPTGTDAQVQGKDFQQAATGVFQIDIGGVALNAFDRLNLTGAAALAGNLNLALIGGFVPVSGQTFTILSAPGGVSGGFASVTQPPTMPAGLGFAISQSAFLVTLTVTTAYDAWISQFGIADPLQRTKSANPDGDPLNNLGEFALDGNPVSGANTGKVVAKIAPVGGVNAFTLTLPVRNGTVLDPADPAGGELGLRNTAEAVSYKIQASDELAAYTLTVTEVTGADATAIQLGLPALNAGWTYRTFRSPGPVAGDPAEYIRIVIGE